MVIPHKFKTKLQLPPLAPLSVKTIGGRRHYVLPDGTAYPSVTTVIGESLPKDHLEAWRKRVGDEEADRIMKIAARRGTIVHSLCERYLLGTLEKMALNCHMPHHQFSFYEIREQLDKNLDAIYAIEYAVYSHILKTAGRTDLVGLWKGVPSIIDFKTSTWDKETSDVLGYFIQATTYAKMIEEHINIKIPQIVIVISIDSAPVKVFVKDKADYEGYVNDIFITKRIECHESKSTEKDQSASVN